MEILTGRGGKDSAVRGEFNPMDTEENGKQGARGGARQIRSRLRLGINQSRRQWGRLGEEGVCVI